MNKKTPKNNPNTSKYIFIAIILFFVYIALSKDLSKEPILVTEYELQRNISNGQIETVSFEPSNESSQYQWVVAKLRGVQASQKAQTIAAEKIRDSIIQYNRNQPKEKHVKFKVSPQNNIFGSLIQLLLPTLVVFMLIYFLLFRQIKKSSGGSPFDFAKSKVQKITYTKEDVCFDDVAGVDEAREEVQEIVSFLKNPKSYHDIGAKLPKGCLMIGPPGTGKTLLARAIAGEADVPFFYVSGSDFVEMFVGVGASRVRDLFVKAKAEQPSIIFIDEIDAIGAKRSSNPTQNGGHDEKEQTLNALLVEMDGFTKNDNLIIIGATNRSEVLDPALLRAGRFNRHIHVGLPDIQGRLAILNIYAKKVSLNKNVNLKITARGTTGFSGADLENLMNEAALIAVNIGRKKVCMADLEEARDKISWGREKKNKKINQKEKKLIAYHEAGHAITSLHCLNAMPLHKVTIIPRGNSYLGAAIYLPEEEKLTQSKEEITDYIAVTMGGRIAEDITLKEISNGAQNDIQQATRMAKSMVKSWGMSSLGFLSFDEDPNQPFTKQYSDKKAQDIDNEINIIIDTQYKRVQDILTKNIQQLKTLAQELLKKETLSAPEIYELLGISPRVIKTNNDTVSIINKISNIGKNFFVDYLIAKITQNIQDFSSDENNNKKIEACEKILAKYKINEMKNILLENIKDKVLLEKVEKIPTNA